MNQRGEVAQNDETRNDLDSVAVNYAEEVGSAEARNCSRPPLLSIRIAPGYHLRKLLRYHKNLPSFVVIAMSTKPSSGSSAKKSSNHFKETPMTALQPKPKLCQMHFDTNSEQTVTGDDVHTPFFQYNKKPNEVRIQSGEAAPTSCEIKAIRVRNKAGTSADRGTSRNSSSSGAIDDKWTNSPCDNPRQLLLRISCKHE